ncbi:MAG: PfkB family carbohydrate kinase [Planctomycetota bacterium]|jgi:D-beta-D-heptose 7-phosphate kinase/D-beta-D-heptose 1-phosphate adenosyltransferase
MHEKLLKAATSLGAPKILVVGDFMLDVYVYGHALRISPEAPVPVLKIKKTEYSCGGASSVANDIAALGGVPICLGIIGNDQNGKILKDMLLRCGADISGLTIIPQRPTISKKRLIGLAQHRHQQQLFRLDEECDEPIEEKFHKQILSLYEEKLKQCDIVCLQDYNKGLLTDAVCNKMIKLAKHNNKKVIVDPSVINDYLKYKGATLVTPNRYETSIAVGFEIKTYDDASKASKLLLEQLKSQAVVITLDKEGAYLRTKQSDRLIPTLARSVYDVTGAGDVVLATLATALAADFDYETAVQLSNIAGGIEVEKFGVATVTVEELINEIIRQKRGKDGKLRSIDSLTKDLDRHRRQGETIVFTNGCFDVVHRGHIEFLRFCKSQGDVVVIGLNSDNSVGQIKGPERPINNQLDRATVLAAMEIIDYITIFDEPEPLTLIKKVKPDVLVKGKDWADKGVIGREFVELSGGKVVLADLVEGKSSSATIEKMKSSEKTVE